MPRLLKLNEGCRHAPYCGIQIDNVPPTEFLANSPMIQAPIDESPCFGVALCNPNETVGAERGERVK